LEDIRMLNTLIESRRTAERGTGGATASVIVHTVVIVLVVAATANAKDHPEPAPARPNLVYLPIKRAAPPPTPATPPARDRTPPPLIPKGFHLLVAPPAIPARIPSIDSSRPATKPGDFSGLGAPGGDADGVGPAISSGPGTVFTGAQVEKQAMVVPGNPKPLYPLMLESAHISGRVLVQFVVDTTGRVDMGTVTVVEATDSLFADAVKRVLSAWRFYPAQVNGHAVRQLVRMSLVFTVP
jgi:protein TonB